MASAASQRGGSLIRWLVVLAIVGGGVWAGVRYWRRPMDAGLAFKTAAVTRGDITQSVTANGSLSPVRMVEVGSQISGVITEIKVDFNSRVKAGDIVAQIDPATYERALRQAEAELANAEAALELAELNFERAQGLFASKLISKSEYDQQRVSLSQAKATVKTRQANVDRAQVDLSRTTIYAPMDGVVITRKVEAGQTVAASMNTPTLFLIANDLAKMQIEAAVSEADVGGVEEGQSVQFTVDAFPGRPFEGKVQQVRFAPTTNQNVVTYTTVVAVDNQELKLRPGMTANARFITAERKNVLKIPNAAARFRPPAGAIVRGDTNALAAASGTTGVTVPLIESGPFAGLPVMPWQTGGERRRPTEEERATYVASLTPDQKQKYEQAMSEIRSRYAQGAGPGGGGFGGGGGGLGLGGGNVGGGTERRRTESEGPRTSTVYLPEKEALPGEREQTVLRAVTVRLGVGDSTSVEVLEGLKEGDVVVSGLAPSTTTASTGTRNLLGGPFGGPPRPR